MDNDGVYWNVRVTKDVTDKVIIEVSDTGVVNIKVLNESALNVPQINIHSNVGLEGLEKCHLDPKGCDFKLKDNELVIRTAWK